MFLDDISVNYWGVVIAAIVYYIIGWVWYAPFLFGDQWGRHDEKIAENRSNVIAYIGEFIIALIIAYVLSLFIYISQANRISEGITVAFWIWIGFIATTHFSAVLWDRKTFKHFLIHAGFMLVGLLTMGAVIVHFS